MLPPPYISAIGSFIPSLIFLTFYFSSIISTKGSLHKYGFLISFLGTGAGAIFSLLVPLLPGESIPWMDIFHGILFLVWLFLVKHYAQVSWLESLVAALLGTLIYAIVTFLVSAVVSGYLEIVAEQSVMVVCRISNVLD